MLNGKPGYINFMDALNSWQLVKALEKGHRPARRRLLQARLPRRGRSGPAPHRRGAAHLLRPEGELSPIACAYIRARGARPAVLLRGLGRPQRRVRRGHRRFLALEVSDGVIAPGYTDEALEILKTKRKGGYNVVEIDPSYEPAPIERRNIYGITFEQGLQQPGHQRGDAQNIVTENKELPQQAKHDMLLSLITLKYTQSNSVCYVKNGNDHRAWGPASRAASTAPVWRATRRTSGGCAQHPKVLGSSSWTTSAAPTGTNAIDLYISDEYEDVAGGGGVAEHLQGEAEVLTAEEKAAWIAQMSGVTVGLRRLLPLWGQRGAGPESGVQYIAQPGGSIRDQQVIDHRQ